MKKTEKKEIVRNMLQAIEDFADDAIENDQDFGHPIRLIAVAIFSLGELSKFDPGSKDYLAFQEFLPFCKELIKKTEGSTNEVWNGDRYRFTIYKTC